MSLIEGFLSYHESKPLEFKRYISSPKSFRQRYLLPALQAGLIEMTLPDKPNSRLQN